MQPNLQLWDNANITTSVLLPLHLALKASHTTTRPISDFPLRESLTSFWLSVYGLLSHPHQEFLRDYVLLIVPAVFIMLLSLCSMGNQVFPRVFRKVHEMKRPVGGFATSLFFTLYSLEVFLHARHSLVHPAELVLDLYFPVHTWVALIGLAVGLHVLGVLHGRFTTFTALLELAGGYLSVLCGVLAAFTSSTSDAYNNLSLALFILSVLLACVTLQAIGLSWGVSVFHELGIISARCITRLKHGVFFITGCCKQGYHQLYALVTAIFCEIIDFISAVITRIRSGDRVSRFIRTYVIQPSIPFQRCVHLLMSFTLHYSWKYTKRLASFMTRKFLSLWSKFVYGMIKAVRTLVNELILPISSFIYSEVSLIVLSIFEAILFISEASWHIWIVVLYDGIVPLCLMLRRQVTAALRMVLNGVCQLIRAVYCGFYYLFHEVVTPLMYIAVDKTMALWTAVLSGASRLCSVVVYDGAIPLGKAVGRAVVWIVRRIGDIGLLILSSGQRFSLFLVENVMKPTAKGFRWLVIAAWSGFMTYVAAPASNTVYRVALFMWHYLFGILLLCFGSKFCGTFGEAVLRILSPHHAEFAGGTAYNLVEALGLLLGGYVCIVTGALLLISKCRPFYKQREIIVFLTCCYQNLDFGLLKLVKCFVSRCKRVSASTFRSVTKFISVVWKAGFDVLDNAFTFVVELTRSISLTLYTFTFKPLGQFVSRGVSAVWNSPYTSFAASCTTIGLAFLCHANNINLWKEVLSLYSICERLMTSMVGHALQFQFLFEQNGYNLSQSVNDASACAITISKLVTSGIPVENIWLTAVNQSLWKLSKLPSLGWTLYVIHLGGGVTSSALSADPKVFVRGMMKVIYYPLIFSFLLSFVPTLGIGRYINVSFGKVYAVYTIISAVVLLMEMQRLRSVPNVRAWNVARQDTARRHRLSHNRAGSSSSNRGQVNLQASAPPAPLPTSFAHLRRRSRSRSDLRPSALSSKMEAPFEYLKDQARPHVVFETPECPICLDDICGVSSPAGESRTDLCLPCGHVYHTDCALDWLRDQPHCPSCRQVVPPQRRGALLYTSNIIQEVLL